MVARRVTWITVLLIVGLVVLVSVLAFTRREDEEVDGVGRMHRPVAHDRAQVHARFHGELSRRDYESDVNRDWVEEECAKTGSSFNSDSWVRDKCSSARSSDRSGSEGSTKSFSTPSKGSTKTGSTKDSSLSWWT